MSTPDSAVRTLPQTADQDLKRPAFVTRRALWAGGQSFAGRDALLP